MLMLPSRNCAHLRETAKVLSKLEQRAFSNQGGHLFAVGRRTFPSTMKCVQGRMLQQPMRRWSSTSSSTAPSLVDHVRRLLRKSSADAAGAVPAAGAFKAPSTPGPAPRVLRQIAVTDTTESSLINAPTPSFQSKDDSVDRSRR